jgi:hypothetical protein
MDTFSERQGFEPPAAEIVVRHEAPEWLRSFVIDQAYSVAGLCPSDLRTYLCDLLYEIPDQGNWSEFPNIDGEVRELIFGKAKWYNIYDLIEWIYSKIVYDKTLQSSFSDKINRAFIAKGVGWQLQDGLIVVRGSEVFQDTTQTAISLANETDRSATAREMQEALHDLSRRPEPDLTGAVHHSMAALECLARDITSEPNLTLGDWMKRHKQEFPAPLDIVVDKLWGYASEKGRHVKEGQLPSSEEAELVVTLSSAFSTYLLRKHPF